MAQDLTGQTFNRWTVLYDTGRRKRYSPIYVCRCQCGTVREVVGNLLTKDRGSKSCGCWRAESTAMRKPSRTHGRSRTSIYNIWAGIVDRCNNPKNTCYFRYGGRGIKVCERWLTFENFLADMGERPGKKSIDRIDNNGNYEPGNCRWATRVEQVSNTRVNRLVSYRGETKPLMVWCRERGLDHHTTAQRMRYGWEPERFLTTPTRKPFTEWKGFKGE